MFNGSYVGFLKKGQDSAIIGFIYRHFPRCALDIIEVPLIKSNYVRMGMVKLALVLPLLRLNRLELSPNYNFLTPLSKTLPQGCTLATLVQKSLAQLTISVKDSCGWIWDNLHKLNKCATNPGNQFSCIKNRSYRICQGVYVREAILQKIPFFYEILL